MGKLQFMALGIIVVCMFGPNLPSKNLLQTDRLLIWKSASKFCMSEDTIHMILNVKEKDPQTVIVTACA